jgi:small-conductance mechanosensitive channel
VAVDLALARAWWVRATYTEKIEFLAGIADRLTWKKETTVQNWLAGKKTYLVMAGALVAALIGYADGAMSLKELLTAAFAALGTMTMRAGVAKNQPPAAP